MAVDDELADFEARLAETNGEGFTPDDVHALVRLAGRYRYERDQARYLALDLMGFARDELARFATNAPAGENGPELQRYARVVLAQVWSYDRDGWDFDG